MAKVFDYLHARREPYQVVGIGQRIRVIEIVDAPRKTAFRVAPGAEAVNVKIATCDNPRSVAQVGANLRPQLSPSDNVPRKNMNRSRRICWCFSRRSDSTM